MGLQTDVEKLLGEKKDHHLNFRHVKCENNTGSDTRREDPKVLWKYHKRWIEPRKAYNLRFKKGNEPREITNALDRSNQDYDWLSFRNYQLTGKKPRALERDCCQRQLKGYQSSVFEKWI